jgi:hypothetical protein
MVFPSSLKVPVKRLRPVLGHDDPFRTQGRYRALAAYLELQV